MVPQKILCSEVLFYALRRHAGLHSNTKPHWVHRKLRRANVRGAETRALARVVAPMSRSAAWIYYCVWQKGGFHGTHGTHGTMAKSATASKLGSSTHCVLERCSTN